MDPLFTDEAPSLSFKEAIRIASKIVPKRSTFPVIQNVLFIVSEDSVILQATDLERAISATVDLGTSKPAPGRYLALLDKIKAGYPLDKILEPENGDYPELPEPGALFPCPWIRELQVCKATMSDDNTRLALNGVVIQPEGLTATDGHRLIHKHLDTGVSAEIIVSSGLVELLGAIKGVPDAMSLSDDGYKLHALFPWGWVAGKTVEVPYPRWRNATPNQTTWSVRMPMPQIKEILARVPKGDKIQVEVVPHGQGHRIQWSNAWADTTALFPVAVDGVFDRIAVHAGYMREMVALLPSTEFVWRGNAEQQATIFGGGPDIYLIMPIRFPKDA